MALVLNGIDIDIDIDIDIGCHWYWYCDIPTQDRTYRELQHYAKL
jgi:hypothetical protein